VTVEELRKKLEAICDPKARIVVYRETGGNLDLFEVSDLSLKTGNPSRDEDTSKAVFEFDGNGEVTWLFISLEEA
jgi:hypothetical protein